MDVSIRFPSSNLASLDKVRRWRPCPPASAWKTGGSGREGEPFVQGVTHTHTHIYIYSIYIIISLYSFVGLRAALLFAHVSLGARTAVAIPTRHCAQLHETLRHGRDKARLARQVGHLDSGMKAKLSLASNPCF